MPPHPDRAIKRNNNRRSSRRQTAVDTGHAAIARVANVRTNETPQSRIGSVRKPDRRHATHRRTIHPSQAGSRYGPAPPGIGCSGSPRLSPRRHSRRGCCSPHDPAATTWSERCLCSRERRAAQTGRRIDLLLATSRAARTEPRRCYGNRGGHCPRTRRRTTTPATPTRRPRLAYVSVPLLPEGPYGGVVADRTDKRRLMVVLQAFMGLQALALGLLAVFGAVPGPRQSRLAVHDRS